MPLINPGARVSSPPVLSLTDTPFNQQHEYATYLPPDLLTSLFDVLLPVPEVGLMADVPLPWMI